MNRILVIGGTGNIGRKVVTQLVAAGAEVRAMVRNPDTAGLPPQVEVLRGDLTLPDTLDESLRGIGAAFLVWTARRARPLLPPWNASPGAPGAWFISRLQ